MTEVNVHEDGQVYSIGQGDEVFKAFSLRTVANSAAYLLPFLREDSRVLDVGCGPGSITSDFATHCPNGRVVGIDQDERALTAARAAYNPSGSEGPAPEFIQCDAGKTLQFQSAMFDIVHAHQLAQFICDFETALQEWRRVLRPNGILAIRVVWLPGLAAAPAHEGFEHLKTAIQGAFQATGGDPQIMLKAPALVRAAGFDNVQLSMGSHVMQTKEELKAMNRFFVNKEMVEGWRKHGNVSEEEIAKILDALDGAEQFEHGFYILPNVELLCRACS